MMTVTKLPALIKGVTSRHDGDFYCLNCLHMRQETNLIYLKKYVRIKIFVVL